MALGPQHLTQGLLFNKHMTHARWTDESVDSVCNTYCEPHIIRALAMFLCFTYIALKMRLKKMCIRSVRCGLNYNSVPHCSILIAGITYRLFSTLVFGPYWGTLETYWRYFSLFYIRYWHFKARDPGWVLNLCSSSHYFRIETGQSPPRSHSASQCSKWTSLRHSSSLSAFLATSASLRSHSTPYRCRGAPPASAFCSNHSVTHTDISILSSKWSCFLKPKIVKLSFIHFT